MFIYINTHHNLIVIRSCQTILKVVSNQCDFPPRILMAKDSNVRPFYSSSLALKYALSLTPTQRNSACNDKS